MDALFIKARGIKAAVIECQRKVLKEGIFIEDNGCSIKEVLQVSIMITNPSPCSSFFKAPLFNPKMLDWMQNNFFSKRPIIDWNYSYGQRLFGYNGINQVKMIIRKLRKNPSIKSAVITLTRPGFDNNHVPCLTTIDFKIRNGNLLLICSFRSQDVFKKMYADILCLARIQKNVADELKVGIGALFLNVASAHIYKDDLAKALTLVKN